MGFTGNEFGVSLWGDENSKMDYDDCTTVNILKTLKVTNKWVDFMVCKYLDKTIFF